MFALIHMSGLQGGTEALTHFHRLDTLSLAFPF